MRSHLNLQVCIFPFFDGGFYITGPTKYMRMVRISLGFIDFRIWWDSHGAFEKGPFDSYAWKPGPAVQIPSKRQVDVVHAVGKQLPEGFDIAEDRSDLVIFQTEEKAAQKAAELGCGWQTAQFALVPASALHPNWEVRETA